MARRKKKTEEHENHERWLVSYADFITLLFAFFTVLYATSVADLQKQEEFQESIKRSFAGYIGLTAGSGAIDEIQDGKTNTIIPPLLDGFPPVAVQAREVQKEIEEKLEDQLAIDENSQSRLIQEIFHDTAGVRIQLKANSLFANGSAELIKSSTVTLQKLGEILKSTNRRLVIEGHTDDLPPSGERYPSNWELSASRATKILRYLMAGHKIPASKMAAVAYADQRPVAPNESEANRAKNRRIEILVVTNRDSSL